MDIRFSRDDMQDMWMQQQIYDTLRIWLFNYNDRAYYKHQLNKACLASHAASVIAMCEFDVLVCTQIRQYWRTGSGIYNKIANFFTYFHVRRHLCMFPWYNASDGVLQFPDFRVFRRKDIMQT